MLEVFKTLTAGILEKAKTFKGDWNENDSSSPNYVKNRTHWSEEKDVTFIPETTITISADNGNAIFEYTNGENFIVGQQYKILWNGVSYNCVAYDLQGSSVVGNGVIAGESGGNNEPFFIALNPEYSMGEILAQTAGTYTFSVTTIGEIVHKIDEKYLPNKKFIVNFDGNTADKTYNQISDAIISGIRPYILYNNTIFDLVSSPVYDSINTYELRTCHTFEGMYDSYYVSIHIFEDNSVSTEERELATINNLPNDYISYTTSMNLTTAQKSQARNNIGAASSDAVLYSAQSLTAAQQSQARSNIGASDFSGDYKDLDNISDFLIDKLGENVFTAATEITEAFIYDDKQFYHIGSMSEVIIPSGVVAKVGINVTGTSSTTTSYSDYTFNYLKADTITNYYYVYFTELIEFEAYGTNLSNVVKFQVQLAQNSSNLYIHINRINSYKGLQYIKEITGVEIKENSIPNTIARVDQIPTGGVTSWNDLEDKPFGYIVNTKYELLNETDVNTKFDILVLPNNIVKENPTDMNSRTITVSGIPLDILDNINYIKYATTDKIAYQQLAWNWIDDTTKQAVYGPYNSTIKVVYSEDYTSATVSIQLATSMDGLLYCVPISIDNVTVNPLSSDFIVLTAPNGIKYSLSVDNDGNLTAVSVD